MATLILVTGTGRSGTSTMAGTLYHLGLDVPGPWYAANESNPKGFFESEWSMDFHKRLCAAADISDVDSRPSSSEDVRAVVTPAVRGELEEFLRSHADLAQLVIKDPRTIWTQWLWRDVASSLGRETRYVSMLRHPAEAVGSRSSHYNPDESRGEHRLFQTMSLARWINNSLTNERGTREEPRSFVRYADLISEWRPVMRGVADDLGLSYPVDPDSAEADTVDDWIEPELRRHTPSWTGMQVPERLVEIAESAWDELNALADHHGVLPGASARLDELNLAFTEQMTDAVNIAHDSIRAARGEGRRSERERTLVAQREKAQAMREAAATIGRQRERLDHQRSRLGRQRERLDNQRKRLDRQQGRLARKQERIERQRDQIRTQRKRIRRLAAQIEEDRSRRWGVRLRRLARRALAPFRRSG